MIRDPSDGTVRERAVAAENATTEHRPEPLKTKDNLAGNPVLSTGVSGLETGNLSDKRAAQLEASREWMKNWHHRKISDHGEG